MDQLIVEIADGIEVRPGDEVVLIGQQGTERITAGDWASLLDTIPYEVLCRFSARVPRIPALIDARSDTKSDGDVMDRLAP